MRTEAAGTHDSIPATGSSKLLAYWAASDDAGCLAALQRVAPGLCLIRGSFSGSPVVERCSWAPQKGILVRQGQLRCELAAGRAAAVAAEKRSCLRSWQGVVLPLCRAALGLLPLNDQTGARALPSSHGLVLPPAVEKPGDKCAPFRECAC